MASLNKTKIIICSWLELDGKNLLGKKYLMFSKNSFLRIHKNASRVNDTNLEIIN